MSQFDSNHWSPIYTEETDYRQSCGEDLFKRLAWNCNFYEPRDKALRTTEEAQSAQISGVTNRDANSKMLGLGPVAREGRVGVIFRRDGAVENILIYEFEYGYPVLHFFGLERDGNPSGFSMPYNGRPFLISDTETQGIANVSWCGVAKQV